MIPTQYKSKLPKHLSYPIGSEAISEALEGAPHVEDLSIWFSDISVWPHLEFRRLLVEKLPYKIIVAEFQPAHRSGLEWWDYKWELHVCPVLREFRPLAHSLLIEEGLITVAEWLRSSLQPGWESRRQRLTIKFNPAAEGTLSKEFWSSA